MFFLLACVKGNRNGPEPTGQLKAQNFVTTEVFCLSLARGRGGCINKLIAESDKILDFGFVIQFRSEGHLLESSCTVPYYGSTLNLAEVVPCKSYHPRGLTCQQGCHSTLSTAYSDTRAGPVGASLKVKLPTAQCGSFPRTCPAVRYPSNITGVAGILSVLPSVKGPWQA